MKKIIKVGCCGWSQAHQKYFQDFKTIEIQETFYQPSANISTYLKWKKDAPADFEFTLKAWQLITHPASSPTYRRLKIKIPENEIKDYGFFKPTTEVFNAFEKIHKIALVLGARIIIFQSPTSFKPEKENITNIRNFFKKIKNKNFIFVWEPRGNWPKDLIKQICQELNLVHCVDPFMQESIYGEINYFRLHGRPNYNLKYRYTDKDLKELEKMCNKEINYCMFNNLFMREDAKRFFHLSSIAF